VYIIGFGAVTSKMEILKDLIGQLDEIESSRRSRRVELYLTFLGVCFMKSSLRFY
jgi:hypothetical protein